MAWAEHADWLLVGALFVLPLALWGVWRIFARVVEHFRDAAHVRAAALLESHRHSDFSNTDALIARLRAQGHPEAVDSAINRELNFARGVRRQRLVKVSRALGIVDRHLDRLRSSNDWVQRAESAYSLGRHRLTEGIPLLVRTLRATDEVKNVKIAAAQALLLMRTPTAVPVLVRELVADDNWASPLIAEVLENIGTAAVPGMLDALGDESLAGARVWLARILAQTGDPNVADAIVPHLEDNQDYVRVAVIDALRALGQTSAIDPLIERALRDPMEHVRQDAARAAASVAEHIAVPRLMTRLDDADYALKIRVIDAVEAIQPSDPACLVPALDDGSAEVRARAARALEELGVVEHTVGLLAFDDGPTLHHAIDLLRSIGRADRAEALVPYVEHTDWRVRYRVADLLGEVGDGRVADSLEALLSDPHGTVRASATQALALLKPRDGVRRLTVALDDDDHVVRTIAAGALQSLEPPTDETAISALLAVYDTADTGMRRAIVTTIGSLDRPEVDERLRVAVVDVDAEVRLTAIQQITERANDSWFEVLAAGLDDADLRVRAAAARGLGKVRTAAALTLLVRHIDTPDRDFREALSDALVTFGPRAFTRLVARTENRERKLALIWTLGKMSSSGAVEPLLSMADEPDASVRAAIAGALGRHDRDQRALNALERLLVDPNERVRAAAANSLGRHTPTPRLARILADALSDPDRFVRGRVALALGRMGGDVATEGLHRTLLSVRDPVERAHIVVGLVLSSNHAALGVALRALEAEGVEDDVRELLEREPDAVREHFRRSLRLEVGGDALPGTGMTAGDLPENYAHTLEHSQWVAARTSAISALRTLGIARHRDLVLRALHSDPAPEVRLMALEALDELGQDPELARWYGKALRDRDLHVRIKAASGLFGRCGSDHFDSLLFGFQAESPDFDEAIIRTLSSAAEADVPRLVEMMSQQTEPTVQAGSAVALAALGDDRAVPLLVRWLQSDNEDVRTEASRTLAELPDSEARRALVRALDGAPETTILTVLDLLPDLVDLDNLEPLMALADHPSAPVRAALARTAGRGPYPKGVEITERLCWDNQPTVRVQALLSLLFIRDSEALERFTIIHRRQPDDIRQLLHRQRSVRLAIVSLRTMASTHRDKGVRAAAVGALTCLGDRPQKLLVRALNDPAREVRVAATEALRGIETPEIREALSRFRSDPNVTVREAARTQRIRVPNPKHTPAPGWEIIRLPGRTRRKRRRQETTAT